MAAVPAPVPVMVGVPGVGVAVGEPVAGVSSQDRQRVEGDAIGGREVLSLLHAAAAACPVVLALGVEGRPAGGQQVPGPLDQTADREVRSRPAGSVR